MVNDTAGPLPETRRLILLNATGADMNFALLARPGTLDGMPSLSEPELLAWKVALVPGQSEGVSSRHHFTWTERQAFLLGRLGRDAPAGFRPEAVIPIPSTGGFTVVAAFVGTARNGAAKVLSLETADERRAALHTDASFPSSRERAGGTRDIAFAVAVDPDRDGSGGAVALALEPNSVVTLSHAPRYWITPVRLDVAAGDLVPPDLSDAAHPLDFDTAVTLRLTFTDRNAFLPTED